MRSFLLAGAIAAAFTLAGCEGPEKADQAESAPAKPKSLGRQQQMYQGQEPILSVESGTVEVSKANPANLTLTIKGSTATAGWTRGTFLNRIYPAAPKDGIYEVDVVAQKPEGAAAQAATPIEFKGEWPNFPADRLKGVRFIAATNDVTVMLPAAPAAK